MGDSKLYSAQDIEKLKQKIATYKDTLTTLKTGTSIDDYLPTKSEANGFKTKVSKLEGVIELMNEKQSVQLEEYEQQINKFSTQIDSLNQTIEELNQDLSLVKNKLINDDSNNLVENLITPVDVPNSANIANDNQEKEEDLIEETTPISSKRKSNLPPSYKQLQSMIGDATNIQEAPTNVTPIVNIDIQKEYSEEQQLYKHSFPYTGIHPSQIYNGLYRNVNRASTIHLTNAVKKHVIPINVNGNSDSSLLQANSKSTLNETMVPDPPLLQTDSKSTLNETVAPDPPLLQADSKSVTNETMPLYPEEVNNIAIVEGDKAPIETSNEMKRQQHKNKEALSLFNMFRKKN